MSDAKFEEKLALGCKNDMMNLVNFNMSSYKPENLHFDVLLLLIGYKDSPIMCRRVISHDTEEWSKLKKKLTFYMKNDMNNLVNFNSSSGKSENLYGIFLSKGCNAWAKKIETSCVVKNDIWFQKWHKEFGEFSE